MAWNEHLTTCEQPRRCPHHDDVVLPAWWWARMRSFAPLDANPEKAVEIAMLRINKFKGGKHVSAEGAAFARDAARDALPAAQQPVSLEWVKQTLACVAGLATWVHNEGEPLTREHVLNANTRLRYLEGPEGATTLSKYSRRNYRLRFDKLAVALLGSQREVIKGRKPMGQPDVLMPLTRTQEADLWVWSQGLRPITTRQRVQALIATGLGTGTRRRDFHRIRAWDVTRDADGVHLSLAESTSTGSAIVPARVVTCSAQWEDRLWAIVESTPPSHYLAAPWKDTEPNRADQDAVLRAVLLNEAALPPVHFSSESLRNTWFLRHLEAGTPISLLKTQGGLLTASALDKLLPFAAPLDAQDAAARMRCTTTATTATTATTTVPGGQAED
ncbi:hypothetical protein [Nocardioides plantarum]